MASRSPQPQPQPQRPIGWECCECTWFVTASQFAVLRRAAGPCPGCGRDLECFRPIHPPHHSHG